MTRYLAPTTAENSAISGSNAQTGNMTIGTRWCERQYVSDALAAQSLSGAVSGQVQCREFNVNDDMTGVHVSVRVVNNTGTHLSHLINLSAVNTASTAVAEFVNNATFRNHSIAKNFTLSSYTCALNDRIVIELGYQSAGTGATPQAGFKFGTDGSLTALPMDEVMTTSGVPWFEFTSLNIAYAATTTLPTDFSLFFGGD